MQKSNLRKINILDNMKKKVLITIFAIFGCFCNIMANNETDYLTIEDVDIIQGKDAVVTVKYHFDYGEKVDGKYTHTYRGFQLALYLPDGITLGSEYTIGEGVAAACPKMTVEGNTKADGTTVFLMFQIDDKDIPIVTEGEEDLFYFSVHADKNIPTGSYECSTIHLEASDFPSGQAMKFDNVTFNFNVLEHTRRVLDDDIIDVAANTNTWNNKEDLLVNRKINANTWSTICLPFDMNTAQITQAFGEDVKIAIFTNRTIKNSTKIVDGEEVTNTTYTINFNNVNLAEGIQANTPYIIKVNKTIESFEVDDATVNVDEENAVVEYKEGRNWKCLMYGTLKDTQLEDHSLFLSGNKIYSATSKTQTMKAYRGYFILKEWGDWDANTDFAFMVDGETTGIEGLTINGKEINDGQVYTLSGVHLGSAEELKGKLTPGIYIVNNKKMIVK